MDTALKHRLTGAVILVLLAVLLLPELLTGSGQAGRNRVSAQAGADGEERSIRIDLTEAATAPAMTTPAAEANPAPARNPTPADVALPTPAEQLPPPEKAAPTVNTVAAAPPVAAAAPSAEAFFVQLGVFENSASARNLERKLRDKNFTPVIDEIERSGKTLHRVRVGPEPDRAAANTLLTRLAAAGHKGSVVK